MSFPRYAEYKDSGVEWLGEVPQGWGVTALKRYCIVKGGYAFPSDIFSDTGEPVIRIGDIKADGSICIESCKFIPVELAKSSHPYMVEKGQLLMAMTGATIGKAGVYTHDNPAYLNQRVGKFVIDNNGLNYSFLWYTLKTDGYQEYIKLTAFGGAQPNISDSGMVDYISCFPLLSEQTQIAAFLDHETAKLDNLINQQKKLIELLKEKRQAVISHAVTKGLNPNAPMKDSGVEWLGKVPEGWGITPLKHLCKLLKDGTHLPPPRVDEGIPLLSVRNIIDNKFTFREDDSLISQNSYTDLCRSFIPQNGDVLLAIVGATLGKVAVIEQMENFHIQRSLGIFRVENKKFYNYYLSNVLSSKGFQSLLWENAGFSAQPGIYLGTLANFLIPTPPLVEQKEIVEFLSKQLEKFNELILKAESAIQLLQERRTALISAAVTGKIDVREYKSLPASL